MDVFSLRERLIGDYADYVSSFLRVRDQDLRETVDAAMAGGHLWPDPLVQLNPAFEAGGTVDDLVAEGLLHPTCSEVFRIQKDQVPGGRPLRLHRHQADAIRAAKGGANYVLTTGTGSGKSLSYILPIVEHVLREGSGQGIRAIIVYPMNALANSQKEELDKFINEGFPDRRGPVTFARYTGQENEAERAEIIQRPPDILLTNYVMLELILTRRGDGTRIDERKLVEAARPLKFLVLDELHTYRGRQGADVGLLVRRVREATGAKHLQHVGTSATLAGEGTFDQQRAEVAGVASRLFGAEVRPEHVICETLRRTTESRNVDAPAFLEELRAAVDDESRALPGTYEAFRRDPLAIWVESRLGLAEKDGRLARVDPRPITGAGGAARLLADTIDRGLDACARAIQRTLMAGYACEPDPATGHRPFAFRLHQFISRGDALYASLEPKDRRFVTVEALRTAPDDPSTLLFPLAFCRECGQEYYVVRRRRKRGEEHSVFVKRELSDQVEEGESIAGYLYLDANDPWNPDAAAESVPDDWVELVNGTKRVQSHRRKQLPEVLTVAKDGTEQLGGTEVAWTAAPFRFCVRCGVSYGLQRSDFGKLATLSSEGRSTATTVLCLSLVRALRGESDLKEDARKVLSFTDNRQDASLQAGHFNDFVLVGLIRGAVYQAVHAAGPRGIAHDELTLKVFDALGLAFEEYSRTSVAFSSQREPIERALRDVIGYHLYLDLRRGWRVTSPNLEQCDLLKIRYRSLDELCASEDHWRARHPVLAEASPATREKVCQTLLDHMRRELALRVDYLTARYQERILQQSSQHLKDPWAFDEDERQLETATTLFPRSRARGEKGPFVYLSPLGSFGRFLGRAQTFGLEGGLKTDDRREIIQDLLKTLAEAGLVDEVVEARGDDRPAGYQVPASGMVWLAGPGEKVPVDPIRVPSESTEGGAPNAFFLAFYRTLAHALTGMEAREHTAQVPYDRREEREKRFREGRLPILFCSPTMELGIDISSLNAVNLRNVPPTPANYAQRSGRAGRSGQPALVFAYCATGSAHDQYFFRRPDRMVAGKVAPPSLDLTNEDLVQAHVRAVWLAQTGKSLHKSLKDILDLQQPELPLREDVVEQLRAESDRHRAASRARAVFRDLEPEFAGSDWYSESWLGDVLRRVIADLDRACERWRDLYRGAMAQQAAQNAVIQDPSRSADDKRRARGLRKEAEMQIDLLLDTEKVQFSDFYSYRYLASEGFLPGYNFPRLPLSAFIPARRGSQDDEYLSRPRFLAISEFGPRAFIYHEGSRYIVNRVLLRADAEKLTRACKQCTSCGYLHHREPDGGPDCCEQCGADLPVAMTNLFRMANVSTRRRDRINSDEEERMRLGYELKTAIRFAERAGRPSFRESTVRVDDRVVATLRYGQAATLWRLNLGWKRRKNKADLGYWLDVERGYWATNPDLDEREEGQEPDERLGARRQQVVPYVEDRRNSLVFRPDAILETAQMATLQAALKSAIQVVFQLEDNELAAEPLPTSIDRQQLLLFESAEGGAGVLRRLVQEPERFRAVVRAALEVCHFDPDTGEDLRRAPSAREDCTTACYDCLMSYTNQPDHGLLDRRHVRDLLFAWRDAALVAENDDGAGDPFENLSRMCGSELERRWLRAVRERELRLPDLAQKRIEAAETTCDFFYADAQTAIYVDGPHHDHPERQRLDRQQEARLEDLGVLAVRFGHQDDWEAVFRAHPAVFGALRERAGVTPGAAASADAFDPDLFPTAWHDLLSRLAGVERVVVEPGRDVQQAGRVVGATVAEVRFGDRVLHLVAHDEPHVDELRGALAEDGADVVGVDPADGAAVEAVLAAVGIRA